MKLSSGEVKRVAAPPAPPTKPSRSSTSGSWGQSSLPCELGRGCWSKHTTWSSSLIPAGKAGVRPAGGGSLGAEREVQFPETRLTCRPVPLAVSCAPRAVKVGGCVDAGAWDACLISWSCPSGIGQTLGDVRGRKDLQGEGSQPSALQAGSVGVTHPSPQVEQRTFSWHPAWHCFY